MRVRRGRDDGCWGRHSDCRPWRDRGGRRCWLWCIRNGQCNLWRNSGLSFSNRIRSRFFADALHLLLFHFDLRIQPDHLLTQHLHGGRHLSRVCLKERHNLFGDIVVAALDHAARLVYLTLHVDDAPTFVNLARGSGCGVAHTHQNAFSRIYKSVHVFS